MPALLVRWHSASVQIFRTRSRALRLFCLLLPFLLAAASPAAAEYRELPRAVVLLDGRPVDVGPVVEDAEANLVPLGKAVETLLRGQATPDREDANPYRVRRGDQILLEIPTDAADTTALVLGRRVPLGDAPQRVRLPGQPERLMIDLKVLAGLLGITADQDGATFSLFTPEYWCAQLGLGEAAARERTLHNLSLLPDIGVSPPARSLLIWVRPRERAQVQIYKLSGGKPEALLGVNQFGRRVTHPNPPLGEPRAWSTEADRPVRVDTLFYGEAPPKEPKTKRYGAYVALISRATPPGGDIARAVAAGEIPPADWCVVGVRQRVVRGVLLYEPYAVAAEDTPAGIAERHQMPLAMLEDLNGLRSGERLTPGEKVVILQGIDVGERDKRQKVSWTRTGYYAVRPGDTIAELARRCRVSPEDFLDANTMLPPGAELEPGEVVTLIKPIQPPPPPPPNRPKPPPPPRPDVQSDLRAMMTRVPVKLRKFVGPTSPVLKSLPAGQAVTVLARIPHLKQCRVSIGDIMGWVPISELVAATFKTPVIPPPNQGQLAGGQKVVQEALRWVGVPRYEWGGNRIDRGIDCSHFVAAAFARTREPCPSPPVHNMETYGSVIHWKPGPVEEYGRVRGLSVSPSVTSLRPGDRIIFQGNPASARQGNHHIGIYVGAYRGVRNAVVHCNSSANTVSVDDLNGRLWRIYRYAVRGAQKRPVGQFAASAAAAAARKGG